MVSNQAPTTLLSRKEGLRKTTQFSRFFFQTTLFVPAHMCEEPRLRSPPIKLRSIIVFNHSVCACTQVRRTETQEPSHRLRKQDSGKQGPGHVAKSTRARALKSRWRRGGWREQKTLIEQLESNGQHLDSTAPGRKSTSRTVRTPPRPSAQSPPMGMRGSAHLGRALCSYRRLFLWETELSNHNFLNRNAAGHEPNSLASAFLYRLYAQPVVLKTKSIHALML